MAALGRNIIMKQLPKYLNKGERVLSVASLVKFSYGQVLLTRGLLFYCNKSFYVGITNESVILLPLNGWTGKVDKEKVTRFHPDDVKLEDSKLYFTVDPNEKPIVLKLQSGIKALSGIDQDEFIQAYYSLKDSIANR